MPKPLLDDLREEGVSETNQLTTILERIDPVAVSEAARRETRNREVHLPPLSTFRWWARRTGSINDAILSAAKEHYGRERLAILDPFVGGGTIPLVALRAGHRVHAQDINPWAVMGVKQMLSLPSAEELESAHRELGELARPVLSRAYGTTMSDGSPGQLVHTFRVAVGKCTHCSEKQRQFPYSLLTLRQRKERRRPEAILACPNGHIFNGRNDMIQECPECDRPTDPAAHYTPRRIIVCPACGKSDRLSDRASQDGWGWEVVLVERLGEGGREFGLPTVSEVAQTVEGWHPERELGPIPEGSETSVLLRHGFRSWEDLYPERQREVTQHLLELAAKVSTDRAVIGALQIAIIGTTEFAGHLSRWDRFYLKCNDATAGHRFNFSTFVPEINIWGAGSAGRGTVTRRIRSLAKASNWNKENISRPSVTISCGSSARLDVPRKSVDVILTDPPYHDDVHYSELSLPFRAWAKLPLSELSGEAASNRVLGLNTDSVSYASSLEKIFQACHEVLREEGRLIFSFANHDPSAWISLFSALQAAGFSAVSCVLLHSENETDFKKRGVGACVSDLLMEFSPAAMGTRGTIIGDVRDEPFMGRVAELFSEVGDLSPGWEKEAVRGLKEATR